MASQPGARSRTTRQAHRAGLRLCIAVRRSATADATSRWVSMIAPASDFLPQPMPSGTSDVHKTIASAVVSSDVCCSRSCPHAQAATTSPPSAVGC
eukprot:6491998-Heterocapsa_arctica.AAC.1